MEPPRRMGLWAYSRKCQFDRLYLCGKVGHFTHSPQINALLNLQIDRYPANNCAAVFGTNGNVINPQDVIGDYLAHSKVRDLVSFYASSTLFAQTQSKPFIMFETNTASCGGFPGISNAFSASLWALDYGLQMAYTNFSEALLHVGGQSVVYNVRILSRLFAPVHSDQSPFHLAIHRPADQRLVLPPVDRRSNLLLRSRHGRNHRFLRVRTRCRPLRQ